MPAQCLTYADIVVAGQKAYKAGTLTAQAKNPEDRRCLYRLCGRDGVEYHCVIGAVLTKETQDKIEHNCIVLDLANSGVISLPPGDMFMARELQRKHDQWATESCAYGEDDKHTIQKKNAFLTQLGLDATDPTPVGVTSA
jgi:hypothetical protein